MLLPELTSALAVMRDRIGAPDDPWCDSVSALTADLMDAWQLQVTGEPALGGSGGICLPVRSADATPAMLKITRTQKDRDLENEVLACWDGLHAVRLLERDDQRHARLLPRLGPSLAQTVDPVTAMEVAGHLARALAVPPPAGLPRMDGFTEQIVTKLATAPSDSYRALNVSDVRAAAATYRDLGTRQPDTLLHGDIQGSNVLRSPNSDWLAIDPLGLVGDSALEALTMLRDRWTELPAQNSPRQELINRLNAFADAAQTERSVVIAWTHARCVRAVVDGVKDDQGLHAWIVDQLLHAT